MVASIRFCQGCVCRMLVLVRNSAWREGSDFLNARFEVIAIAQMLMQDREEHLDSITTPPCRMLKLEIPSWSLWTAFGPKKAQVWQYQQQKSRTTSPHASFWYWRCRGQDAVLCFSFGHGVNCSCGLWTAWNAPACCRRQWMFWSVSGW